MIAGMPEGAILLFNHLLQFLAVDSPFPASSIYAYPWGANTMADRRMDAFRIHSPICFLIMKADLILKHQIISDPSRDCCYSATVKIAPGAARVGGYMLT